MSREKNSASRHGLAVVILAFAVFLAGLPGRPVPTIDGAVRSSLARNIITSGQWFPLTYQGKVFIDHPPLYVWTVAGSFKVLGVNDFAANFPMHVFAFLTVIMTYLLARRARFNQGVALAAAITLCATRDFVLSSVRGYIEPLLEFCIYTGFYFIIRQLSSKKIFSAVLAALFAALAWFAKGPPALWPTLFFGFLLLVNPQKSLSQRLPGFAAYFVSCILMFLGAIFVINRPDILPHFQEYFHKQVLGSALQARNNAQTYDPFYFFDILWKFYWPWLPFLVFALWRSVFPKKHDFLTSLNPPLPTWIFSLFGLGFFGGFSIVKWKFWYYIAPAYPAFSIAIAATTFQKIANILERSFFPKLIINLGILWILAVCCLPIELYRDRVPEIKAFAPTISHSEIKGPVWFINNPADHNLIATSGEWSFNAREVVKIDDEAAWSESLKSTAWIITGSDFWNNRENQCHYNWCRQSRLIQKVGRSALLLYESNER